jgi:glycine cleavage system protein P-like pyridoxal-binding family
VRTPLEPALLIERLLEEGFLAGTVVDEGFAGTSYAGSLLVATTERRTKSEIDAFVAVFDKAVR